MSVPVKEMDTDDGKRELEWNEMKLKSLCIASETEIHSTAWHKVLTVFVHTSSVMFSV